MDLPKTKEELYGTYYLKADLIMLCKRNDLPASGSKEDLLEYISSFIQNKSIVKKKAKQKSTAHHFEPSLNNIIDKYYSNDEKHRAFFKKHIGDQFKFNVQFMNWMEENKGERTYKDAIEIYKQIAADKKSQKKTVIGKQFEYNQYTRDFFADNPTRSKEDCIACWNYKKTQFGNHIYEKSDLAVLEKNYE